MFCLLKLSIEDPKSVSQIVILFKRYGSYNFLWNVTNLGLQEKKPFDLRYREISYGHGVPLLSWWQQRDSISALQQQSAQRVLKSDCHSKGGRYNSSFMCHKKAKNSVTQAYEENLSKKCTGFLCVSYSHIAMEQEQAGRRRLNRT